MMYDKRRYIKKLGDFKEDLYRVFIQNLLVTFRTTGK